MNERGQNKYDSAKVGENVIFKKSTEKDVNLQEFHISDWNMVGW